MSDDIIKRLRRDLELGSTASGRVFSASPDNIAALLDRLDKAKRENERLRAERDEHARWRVDLADKLHDAESQISAAWAALRRAGIQSEETVAEAIALLHAENERLREDAKRPPTPVGWSDTDWIKHLQEQPRPVRHNQTEQEE